MAPNANNPDFGSVVDMVNAKSDEPSMNEIWASASLGKLSHHNRKAAPLIIALSLYSSCGGATFQRRLTKLYRRSEFN
jgi:hypothetical protein